MTSIKKSVLEWFGYSRRERRSSFILLIILVIIICIGYVLPSREPELKDFSQLLFSVDSLKSRSDSTSDTVRQFYFDPNWASFDTLTRLGLSEKQAGTIVNYRNKGGRFLKPADFRKIYGIDEITFTRLIPYIYIAENSKKTKYNHLDSVAYQKKAEKIDLNKADSATLERLPGIGPVLALRIIKYRKLLGGFARIEQLKEVYGLHEETYSLFSGKVFADSLQVIRININIAGTGELARHPYFDKYDILAILKYREISGIIHNIDELTDNNILTKAKAKKISPYLYF
jgi:competence protein ComEA